MPLAINTVSITSLSCVRYGGTTCTCSGIIFTDSGVVSGLGASCRKRKVTAERICPSTSHRLLEVGMASRVQHEVEGCLNGLGWMPNVQILSDQNILLRWASK